MTDLERDNALLRGALIFAAREIKRLNFGKRDTPALRKLRAAYKEVAKGDKKASLCECVRIHKP